MLGVSPKKISKEDYQETILNHNLTPRKSLNWLTPLEAFTQSTLLHFKLEFSILPPVGRMHATLPFVRWLGFEILPNI